MALWNGMDWPAMDDEEGWAKLLADAEKSNKSKEPDPESTKEAEKEEEEEDVLKYLEDVNKDLPQGAHCVRCKATTSEARLCTVSNYSNSIVSVNTPDSHVECWDTIECKDRKEGKPVSKHKKNKYEAKSSYSSGNVTYFSKCRHEATAAFKIGENLTFYGGSESKVQNQIFDQNEWLIVSLLGKSYSKEVLTSQFTAWLDKLSQYIIPSKMIPQLAIDWPDYGVPALKPGFWTELIKLAVKKGYKNILFYCVGGHGRTGTALSSILIECADMNPAEAVGFVRQTYCKECVESQSQVDYLKALYKAATGKDFVTEKDKEIKNAK